MKTLTNRLAHWSTFVLRTPVFALGAARRAHITHATMIAAVLAAGFTTQTAQADQAVPVKGREARVIQLPTVVIVSKRIPVIQLERVVIVGHRLAAATLVAQRAPRGTTATKSGQRV